MSLVYHVLLGITDNESHGIGVIWPDYHAGSIVFQYRLKR